MAKKLEFVGFPHTETYSTYDDGAKRQIKNLRPGDTIVVSDVCATRLLADFAEANRGKAAFRVVDEKVAEPTPDPVKPGRSAPPKKE